MKAFQIRAQLGDLLLTFEKYSKQSACESAQSRAPYIYSVGDSGKGYIQLAVYMLVNGFIILLEPGPP